jgi:hypothetical protein
MSDDIEHWKKMAANLGIQRNLRAEKQTRIAKQLNWDSWSQEEREVYASAFLFPGPVEPLINGITINGVVLNMQRLSRTARIIEDNGTVWLVVEHMKPEKL